MLYAQRWRVTSAPQPRSKGDIEASSACCGCALSTVAWSHKCTGGADSERCKESRFVRTDMWRIPSISWGWIWDVPRHCHSDIPIVDTCRFSPLSPLFPAHGHASRDDISFHDPGHCQDLSPVLHPEIPPTPLGKYIFPPTFPPISRGRITLNACRASLLPRASTGIEVQDLLICDCPGFY